MRYPFKYSIARWLLLWRLEATSAIFFTDELPDDLLYKSCRHIARQPHSTSCCGEHYYHTCITPIL